MTVDSGATSQFLNVSVETVLVQMLHDIGKCCFHVHSCFLMSNRLRDKLINLLKLAVFLSNMKACQLVGCSPCSNLPSWLSSLSLMYLQCFSLAILFMSEYSKGLCLN